MQEAALGQTLPPGCARQRGDLIFWRGHVGILRDSSTLLHANAHAMCVTQEPLAQAISRIEAAGEGPPTRHARLDAS